MDVCQRFRVKGRTIDLKIGEGRFVEWMEESGIPFRNPQLTAFKPLTVERAREDVLSEYMLLTGSADSQGLSIKPTGYVTEQKVSVRVRDREVTSTNAQRVSYNPAVALHAEGSLPV